MSADWIAEACRAELLLLDRAIRADPARVSALLHADFVEVGSSGRRWSRAEVLSALAQERDPAELVASDMAGKALSESVVLLTYRCRRAEVETWRSSIWIREGESLRLIFHQGTRID